MFDLIKLAGYLILVFISIIALGILCFVLIQGVVQRYDAPIIARAGNAVFYCQDYTIHKDGSLTLHGCAGCDDMRFLSKEGVSIEDRR